MRLGAVVDDAYQPHSDRDGRIPARVDDAVHILTAHAVEILQRPLVHRRVVVDQYVRPIWPDARNLLGAVAEARVIRVGVFSKPFVPACFNPGLRPGR